MAQDHHDATTQFKILYAGGSRKRNILTALESEGLKCQFQFTEDREKALILLEQNLPEVVFVDLDHVDLSPLLFIEYHLERNHRIHYHAIRPMLRLMSPRYLIDHQ